MPLPLDAIIIVLDRPRNPANIGAVVRAMKNMGFADLRLVNPAAFERTDLLRYAHRCEDLVETMTLHAGLDDALADATFVVGAAALDHPDRVQTDDVRGLATDLLARAQVGAVALVFGTEADGLDRAALDRCHLVASLPVDPAYPALNLAQSVLLFLYELRMARHAASPVAPAGSTAPGPAPQAELAQLFTLTEELLERVEYFRYSPTAVMRTLRNITYRAELSSAEAALLMGIVRKLMRRVS